MITITRQLGSAVVVVSLLWPTVAAAQQASGSGGTEVAARVGDRVITVKELEDRWQAEDPAEHAETVQDACARLS